MYFSSQYLKKNFLYLLHVHYVCMSIHSEMRTNIQLNFSEYLKYITEIHQSNDSKVTKNITCG